jgi:hypothetical protein
MQPLVEVFVNQPADFAARLRAQAARTTPPYLLQQAVLKSIGRESSAGAFGALKGFGVAASGSSIRSKDGGLIAKVEIHALDAHDQILAEIDHHSPAPPWISAMFNPSEMSRSIKVGYAELKVPGTSAPIINYVGTEAQVVKFTLFFDAYYNVHADEKGRGTLQNDLDAIARGVAEVRAAQNFLEAVCYPRESNTQDAADGAPPRLLFSWPGVLAIRCVMTDLELKDQFHAPTGEVLRFTADVTLREVPMAPITFDHVISAGPRRMFRQDSKKAREDLGFE